MYVQWVMGSYNLWLTALWYLIRIAKNAPLGVLRARMCVLRKTCGTVRAVDVCGAFPRRRRAPRRLCPRKAGFGIWSQFTHATMQNTWQKIENWFDFSTVKFHWRFSLFISFKSTISLRQCIFHFCFIQIWDGHNVHSPQNSQHHSYSIPPTNHLHIPKTKKATEYFPDEHH